MIIRNLLNLKSQVNDINIILEFYLKKKNQCNHLFPSYIALLNNFVEIYLLLRSYLYYCFITSRKSETIISSILYCHGRVIIIIVNIFYTRNITKYYINKYYQYLPDVLNTRQHQIKRMFIR